MAGENTIQTLDGLFKEVYADKIVKAIPLQNRFLQDIPFVGSGKREGNKFNQPVNLSMEHGVTYAAPDSGAFALKSAIASQTKNATVNGSQVLLRGSLDYESAAKAANGDKAAFVTATHYTIQNMLESISKRVEISTIYGNKGIAITDGTTNTNATTTVVDLTTASFGVAIWTGMENAEINFYNGATQINGSTGIFTISSVDVSAKTVTVTGVAADITALDGFAFGTLDVYFEGSKDSEMVGIDGIITNTSTLFGIDASVYSLWKGNVISAGTAALTMDKVINGISIAQGFGLNEKVCLYVNPKTWNNLNGELAGNRRYDGSYQRKGENGFMNIEYYSQNGGIEVVSHSYIKEGEAFCIPKSKWKRLGAQDISFNTPGRGKEEIFRQLNDNAGYEYRTYSNQAIFCSHPARNIKFTDIVNS
jgi:hypothetical protein